MSVVASATGSWFRAVAFPCVSFFCFRCSDLVIDHTPSYMPYTIRYDSSTTKPFSYHIMTYLQVPSFSMILSSNPHPWGLYLTPHRNHTQAKHKAIFMRIPKAVMSRNLQFHVSRKTWRSASISGLEDQRLIGTGLWIRPPLHRFSHRLAAKSARPQFVISRACKYLEDYNRDTEARR